MPRRISKISAPRDAEPWDGWDKQTEEGLRDARGHLNDMLIRTGSVSSDVSGVCGFDYFGVG
jgi:hypothetical protein